MKKEQVKEFTSDGYEIVYISKHFFDILEKELAKVARIPGDAMGFPRKMSAIRDVPAQIEFRRMEEHYA